MSYWSISTCKDNLFGVSISISLQILRHGYRYDNNETEVVQKLVNLIYGKTLTLEHKSTELVDFYVHEDMTIVIKNENGYLIKFRSDNKTEATCFINAHIDEMTEMLDELKTKKTKWLKMQLELETERRKLLGRCLTTMLDPCYGTRDEYINEFRDLAPKLVKLRNEHRCHHLTLKCMQSHKWNEDEFKEYKTKECILAYELQQFTYDKYCSIYDQIHDWQMQYKYGTELMTFIMNNTC